MSQLFRCAVVLALAAGVSPVALQAQSVLASQGLGYVVEPADARGRALGGILMGLPGVSLMPQNPAEILTAPFASATLGFQQDLADAGWTGQRMNNETARFPYVGVVFPAGASAALSLAFVSHLDQNWRAMVEDTLVLGGQEVAVLDQYISTGGVAQLRLGGAYRITPTLFAGLGLNLYTGANERTQVREYAPASGYAGSFSVMNYRYGGTSGSAGVRWMPHEAAVLSASLSLGGTLTGTPTETGEGTARSYDLPWEVSGGGSVRVAPAVVLAAGGSYRPWSSLDGTFQDAGGARDAWSFGGGVELDPGTLTRRVMPLRLGARTAALPFQWDGGNGDTGWVRESALSAGAGLRMANGLVRVDAGAERGMRGGAEVSFEESFWRFSLSAVISGR